MQAIKHYPQKIIIFTKNKVKILVPNNNYDKNT
jgi:hypothetical protein